MAHGDNTVIIRKPFSDFSNDTGNEASISGTWVPERECKLTFLSTTDIFMYAYMQILRIDPLFRASYQCTRQHYITTVSSACLQPIIFQ